MTLKLGFYLAIAIGAIAIGGGLYYKIYKSGGDAVRVEQEKKLNTLKDKTHDAQTDALTAPDPRSELRKYSRPD